MNEGNVFTKDMLMNISSMKVKAMELTKNGKPYCLLLKDILARDLYYDDEAPMTSLKELAEATGIKYAKVRKYIQMIYHDLVVNHLARPVFSFSKVRYEFLMRGRGKKFYHFETDQLPVMLRVGEELSLPFFSAYMGTSTFFVEDVNYQFEEETQIIKFWLREGSYNSYWHLGKTKQKRNMKSLLRIGMNLRSMS